MTSLAGGSGRASSPLGAENYVAMAAALGIEGRVGGHDLVARCPLHQDKHPSFSLSIQSGVWCCFSNCGKGDFVSLVRRVLDCNLREAIAWIREHEQGIDSASMGKTLADRLSPAEVKPKNIEWQERYERLDNAEMPKYLLERGLTWPIIERWGLRFDPLYSQVVIPVLGEDQELLGTISRNPGSVEPKYINNSGLAKSEALFGWPKDWRETIVLVEGPLDAIWIYEAGYCAKAILGALFSRGQEERLTVRLGASSIMYHAAGPSDPPVKLVLWFDNDEAGIQAENQVKIALARYFFWSQIYKAMAPQGKKDAQECTFEEVREAIEQAQPIYSSKGGQ